MSIVMVLHSFTDLSPWSSMVLHSLKGPSPWFVTHSFIIMVPRGSEWDVSCSWEWNVRYFEAVCASLSNVLGRGSQERWPKLLALLCYSCIYSDTVCTYTDQGYVSAYIYGGWTVFIGVCVCQSVPVWLSVCLSMSALKLFRMVTLQCI